MGFSWIYSVAAIPSGSGVILFAGAGGVLRSTDDGVTWTPTGALPVFVYALTTAPNVSGGTDLVAGTAEGVFRSADNGASWVNVSMISTVVRAITATPNGDILAGTDRDVFQSSDGGATWTDRNANTAPLDFAVNPADGVVYSGDALTGVFKSTDGGATWSDTNTDIGDIEVNSVAVVPNGSGGTNVIAGTYMGIYTSTSAGASWFSAEPTAMPLDFVVVPNAAGGQTIFGGGFGGVWKSTNYGASWTLSNFGGTPQGMATTDGGSVLFAGGDPFGVYRSTDQGATWSPVNNGLTDLRITDLLSPDGTNLFAGGAGGVFLSTDRGEHWIPVSTGLTTGIQSLGKSADGTELLAGTSGYGVWKRPFAEMMQVTSVAADDAPRRQLALRAYPNPFNPSTTIRFSLSGTTPVRLSIVDITGRHVRTLVDEIRGAGEQRLSWDGKDDRGNLLGSGVYLYRLDAEGESRTGKLSLMK
jgi:photosystem II stability/assembly factor-like uncharacterized protein